VRIYWHEERKVFAAEFHDFQTDLDSVKSAGFRTFGPPEWIWYAPPPGVKALNRLRENKPASGLTLTEVAFNKYKIASEKLEQKDALKKQFQDAQKIAKKQSKDPEISGLTEIVIPEKGYIDQSDLPPFKSTWVPWYFPKPDVYCFICGDPLYLPFPDYPDVCGWCDIQQKISIDKTKLL
jgi:hypothetical protein